MPPIIATLVCLIGILGLFLLDHDRKTRTSWALVIPFAWLFISASRMASRWFGIVGSDSADQLLEGSRLDALIFTGLIALAFVVLFARRRRMRSVLRGSLPLLVFLSYCALSVTWSDYPTVALKRWFKAVGDLSMILVVLTDPAPHAAVKRVFGRAGFLLVPLSILLIRYYPSLGRAYSGWTGEAYNIGISTGKNGLGYVCLMCGLASFWCFLEVFRSRHRARPFGSLLAHGAILAMVIYLFRITHSATSFGCFIIGCGFIALANRRMLTRNPALVHVLVGTVLFAVLYVLVLNPSAGLLDAMGRDATLTGRTALWAQVLRIPVNPLVGAGYESFWLGERLESIWKEHWEHPTQAHNGYLELYLDLGWLGLALATTFIIYGYRDIIGALRRNQELARLRLAYFVVAAIYNFTEHAFRELHPVWIMLLLAATVVRTSPLSTTTEARSMAPRGRSFSVRSKSNAAAAYPPVYDSASGLHGAEISRSMHEARLDLAEASGKSKPRIFAIRG